MKQKKRVIRLLLFVALTVFALSVTNQHISVYSNDDFSGNCKFISCDEFGNEKDIFLLSEDVYVKGGCFGPFNDVDIYVVPNGVSTEPGNAVSGPIAATTDGDGHLPITLVWSNPLILGDYDVWVDVNQNGVFEWWLDGHYYCICRPYLFHVIPEYFIGSIGALIAMFGSFVFLRRKMHK